VLLRFELAERSATPAQLSDELNCADDPGSNSSSAKTLPPSQPSSNRELSGGARTLAHGDLTMWRDFWGVAVFVFVATSYVIFRISPLANTPLPISVENALFWIVLLGLLLVASVCFSVWLIGVAVWVFLSGRWRHLSRERLLLASVIALLWVSYSDLDAGTRYTPTGSEWWANLPWAVLGAFFIWGVVTNTVIVYWLTGAIHRLGTGDRAN